MPLVLLTRPQAAAEQTAARIKAATLWPVMLAPMATIEMLAPPPPLAASAVVLTSANAAPALAPYRHLPVFAVGDQTASAARAAGCTLVQSAAGDAPTLAKLVQQQLPEGRVVYLSGQNVRHDLAALLPNYEVIRQVVYRSIPATSLPSEAAAALQSGQVRAVLFYAKSAMETLSGLTEQRPPAFCLSAALVVPGWPTLTIAPAPTEEALLETLYSAYDKNQTAS